MSSSKIYPTPANFQKQANVTAATAREWRTLAESDPELFWSTRARECLEFQTPFLKSYGGPPGEPSKTKWFTGGRLNVSYNCIDRHLFTHGDRPAILWEAEPLATTTAGEAEIRQLSYRDLHALTCQIANFLRALGVGQGDPVAIYMPMVPETIATMQACARIGAVHTVIFGGFAPQAIADRLVDSQAKVIVTADGTFRKGAFLALKEKVDEAFEILEKSKAVHAAKKVLVYERDPKYPTRWVKDRDVRWSESVARAAADCPPVWLASEDPLFILYTSGTTGKPKGLFHTQAGYLLGAHLTTQALLDVKREDLFWCTADCGWITGHTYVAYGPLSVGATVFMYEGAPTTPTHFRYWEMIDRHKINILYTAPTAIRMFMRGGDLEIRKYSLASLRLLGTVGEPINPEVWRWYHDVIGRGRCPIVDTWWQTETGSAMIAPLLAETAQKPGSATRPFPGISARIVDAETGLAISTPGQKGALIIEHPWPSMARGIWGDQQRFEKTYWKTSAAFDGVYLTGDLASQDADGYFWIEGRMDDVLNVSGHRIGSAEVESALVSFPEIVEAAVVGVPDEIKGQKIAAFVTLSDQAQARVQKKERTLTQLKTEAQTHVAKQLGSHAKPDVLRIAKSLPKTRSGKIMRRLLREFATTGKMTGDTSTLEDFSSATAIEEDS